MGASVFGICNDRPTGVSRDPNHFGRDGHSNLNEQLTSLLRHCTI